MGRVSDARERLVASISELVHERGYNGVGVGEICQKAGVKKGSFYHFFESKEELMMEALDQRWTMTETMFVPHALADDIAPLARITRFFTLVGEAEKENLKNQGSTLGCPFGGLVAELGNENPAIRKKVATILAKFARHLKQTLDEAKSAGEISAEMDTQAAAESLIAYMEGLLLLSHAQNNPELIISLGKKATQLVLK